uniref:Uncharacterized protein n=1 Tax=Schistosoma japonicum TaxID=6182 RepID=C7TR14_SCHJA|nr:hypothetical protein [Schistosoma japonicum]
MNKWFTYSIILLVLLPIDSLRKVHGLRLPPEELLGCRPKCHYCGKTADCCEGLICTNGQCHGAHYGESCKDKRPCCSGLKCVNGKCNYSYEGPIYNFC